MVKRAGADPPELHLPPEPPELHFLMPVFRRLTNRRGYAEGGIPLAITHSEIEAFCRLNTLVLRPWEIELLELLDDAYRAAATPRVSQTMG